MEKQNHLHSLDYDYFVIKNSYHLIKDKFMPRNAFFGIKAGFMKLICARVYHSVVINRAKFDACTSSNFRGVKTDRHTFTQTDRIALYILDYNVIVQNIIFCSCIVCAREG